MIEKLVMFRNSLNKFFYKTILKPIFFRMDPEVVHDRMLAAGKMLGSFSVGRWLLRSEFNYKSAILKQKIAGLTFENPLGLAAGFDKNAELTKVLPQIGFAFAELGSVTGETCAGNPKPRLWRLKKSESLVVHYGLKNDGAEVVAERVGNSIGRAGHRKKIGRKFIYGISVAKTNNAETCDTGVGVADYVKAYRAALPVADYITVNISCPNTFGGEPFTDKDRLKKLLTELDKYYVSGKPVLVKLSPDLSVPEIEMILKVCAEHKVDGFVCTNLTKVRNNANIRDTDVPEKGGISGKVVRGLSDDLIARVYRFTKGEKIIVGVGGVFSAEDAYAKIRKGANLVQLITGMIFEGPSVISEINQGLVRLLEKDGFKSVEEAVGIDTN
jgi:dihydroorotate dehydrogenase